MEEMNGVVLMKEQFIICLFSERQRFEKFIHGANCKTKSTSPWKRLFLVYGCMYLLYHWSLLSLPCQPKKLRTEKKIKKLRWCKKKTGQAAIEESNCYLRSFELVLEEVNWRERVMKWEKERLLFNIFL